MIEPHLPKFAQVRPLSTSFRFVNERKSVKSQIPYSGCGQKKTSDFEPSNCDKNLAVNLRNIQLLQRGHYKENDKFSRNKSVKKRSKSQDSGYDQVFSAINKSSQSVASRSAMQTLDRRISASSDQLDTLKKLKNREKPVRTRSSSRISFERKFQSEDYHLERDKSAFTRGNGSKRSQGGAKTPFEMFLEDDGPYSRKLYGPVTPKAPSRNRKTCENFEFVNKAEVRREKVVYTSFLGSQNYSNEKVWT